MKRAGLQFKEKKKQHARVTILHWATKISGAVSGTVLNAFFVFFITGCDEATPVSTSREVNPQPSQNAPTTAIVPDTAPSLAVAPADDNLVVIVRTEPYETFVDVTPKGKETPRAMWRRKQGLLSIRWDAGTPLQKQVPLLQKLVTRLHEHEGDAVFQGQFAASLAWYSYPAYGQRLALFAASDPAWINHKKKGRGRPRWKWVDPAHFLHEYILNTTNKQNLVPELNQIVAPFNVTVQLTHVEKCSDFRPGAPSEMGQNLHRIGIRSHRRIPGGCLMADFRFLERPARR